MIDGFSSCHLPMLAGLLDINLVIVCDDNNPNEIVHDSTSMVNVYEWDHICFRSALCKLLAESKGLFTQSDHRAFSMECSLRTPWKVRQIYCELHEIREEILSLQRQDKSFEKIVDHPYRSWVEKYVQNDSFDYNGALSEIGECELYFHDLWDSFSKAQAQRSSPCSYKKTVVSHHQHKVSDHHCFSLDDELYHKKNTRGDGACALHAMLGEDVDGEYRCSGPAYSAGSRAKENFAQRLRDKLSSGDETICSKFIEAMSFLLGASSSEPSANMLFYQSPDGLKIKREWDELSLIYARDLGTLKDEEERGWLAEVSVAGSPILEEIMQEVNALTIRGHVRDPFLKKMLSRPLISCSKCLDLFSNLSMLKVRYT
jgi:hypothetical protein